MKRKADIIDDVMQTAIQELVEEGYKTHEFDPDADYREWFIQYLYEAAIAHFKEEMRGRIDFEREIQQQKLQDRDEEFRTSSKQEANFNWS